MWCTTDSTLQNWVGTTVGTAGEYTVNSEKVERDKKVINFWCYFSSILTPSPLPCSWTIHTSQQLQDSTLCVQMTTTPTGLPAFLSFHHCTWVIYPTFWHGYSFWTTKYWRWRHFEVLGTVQPATQCHCPEDLYLQQQQVKTSNLSWESPWAKMA